MRRIHAFFAFSMPVVLVLAAGCSTPEYEAEQAREGRAALDQADPAEQLDPAEADLHQRHRPGRLIKETIARLDLRPEQTVAVHRIHQTILNKVLTTAGEHQALVEALARTLGSGFVDQRELDQALGRVAREVATMKPTFITAINELHRTLDAEQRARLVQLLEQHHARHQQRMDRGCQGRGHVFKRLDRKLGLTAQQREQIHQLATASLTPAERARMRTLREERWQRHKAALEAFKAERFDAASLPVFNQPHDGKLHAERMARLLKVALPVLSAEQRTRLAQQLQQGARLFFSRLQADALK